MKLKGLEYAEYMFFLAQPDSSNGGTLHTPLVCCMVTSIARCIVEEKRPEQRSSGYDSLIIIIIAVNVSFKYHS